MWPRCGRAVVGLLRGRRRRRRSRELADGAVFHAQASAPSASSCSARCATSPSRSALTGGSRQTCSRSSAPQPEAGLEGRCSLVEGEGACPLRVGAPTRCRGASRRTRASSTATTRPGTRTRSKAASPLPAGRHTAAPSVSGLPSAPSRRPRLEARPDLGQTSARPSQTSAVSPDRPRQEARRRAAGRRRRAAQPAARLQRRPALQAAAGGGGRNFVEHAAPPHRAHDAAGQQRGARRPQGRAVTRVCRGWRCTHSRIEVPYPVPSAHSFLYRGSRNSFLFFAFWVDIVINPFGGGGTFWNTSV